MSTQICTNREILSSGRISSNFAHVSNTPLTAKASSVQPKEDPAIFLQELSTLLRLNESILAEVKQELGHVAVQVMDYLAKNWSAEMDFFRFAKAREFQFFDRYAGLLNLEIKIAQRLAEQQVLANSELYLARKKEIL